MWSECFIDTRESSWTLLITHGLHSRNIADTPDVTMNVYNVHEFSWVFANAHGVSWVNWISWGMSVIKCQWLPISPISTHSNSSERRTFLSTVIDASLAWYKVQKKSCTLKKFSTFHAINKQTYRINKRKIQTLLTFFFFISIELPLSLDRAARVTSSKNSLGAMIASSFPPLRQTPRH